MTVEVKCPQLRIGVSNCRRKAGPVGTLQALWTDFSPGIDGGSHPFPTSGSGNWASGRCLTRSKLPQKLGRFEIRSKLGAGAFGAVYRAYDPLLEREVALKVPHPGAGK